MIGAAWNNEEQLWMKLGCMEEGVVACSDHLLVHYLLHPVVRWS
jgi:hypothetical protein